MSELGTVRPEQVFARVRVAAEPDREEQVAAALEREIVGPDREHLSVFRRQRWQSRHHVGEAAVAQVVARDGARVPVAARAFRTRPARTVATAARLGDVQGPFRAEGEAAGVVESVDHDFPRGLAGEDQWTGQHERDTARNECNTFSE